MASYIPFVNTLSDCRRLKFYPGATKLRVSLETIGTFRKELPKRLPLWIDPAMDGYHYLLISNDRSTSWKKYIKQFKNSQILSNTSFLKKRELEKVKQFVTSILDKCNKLNPDWITVPQLPIVEGTSRNKINRALAAATSEWKEHSGFNGKFILPLIFTHQEQLKGKTEWRKKLTVAKTCYRDSGAFGVWTVDSSLSDQKGSGKYDKRFQALIEFHKDLQQDFPDGMIIAGPYWGMNLILWVRGLCDYPAIGLGTAYQYHISGGFFPKSTKTRLAIPPLRRWAVAESSLKTWLDNVLEQLDPTDTAYKHFLYLRNNFSLLSIQETAKDQVAKFYKKWIDKLEDTPPPGRALALYQDLSSAYVTGKQEKLPELPRSEAPGRAPEKVAQQFMLNCL